ncbi:hypothetical protein [Streptomyces sp. NPDC054783]
MRDVAYCMVLREGQWIGPRNQDGSLDRTIVDEILEKRSGSAQPLFLRVTEAGSAIGKDVPHASSNEYRVMRELIAVGVKLGVAVNVLHGAHPSHGCVVGTDDRHKRDGCLRTVDDILAQAKKIKENGGDFYDWIFLDFAWARTPAGSYGLNDLQRVVDGLLDLGWARIMINATGFGTKRFADIPKRTWGIARHFELLADSKWQENVGKAVKGHGDALLPADLQFVDFVRSQRPESCAVLKLEIHNEVDEFLQLSSTDQNRLLQLWAAGGASRGYRMIYPLFVGVDHPANVQKGQYDSRVAGTFWPQRELMYRYS